MILQERADLLSKVLNSDQERIAKLAGLEASEALKEINDLGYDFTLKEIEEYATLVRKAQKGLTEGEELNMGELDEVAGGGSVAVSAGPIKVSFTW